MTKTYFIQCGDYIKIGKSLDVEKRMASLQASTPYPLRLLYIVNGDHEKKYHKTYKSLRINGEWFVYAEPLISFIFERIGEQKQQTAMGELLNQWMLERDRRQDILVRVFVLCLDGKRTKAMELIEQLR